MAYTKDDWWATGHPAGKRVGWMLPYEFVDTLVELCGSVLDGHAPFIEFSIWAGVGKSTVYRWADGVDPIPKWVALLLQAESTLHMSGDDLTMVEADWLPYSDGVNGRRRPKHTTTRE